MTIWHNVMNRDDKGASSRNACFCGVSLGIQRLPLRSNRGSSGGCIAVKNDRVGLASLCIVVTVSAQEVDVDLLVVRLACDGMNTA